ncbi:MAG: hypothetical protein EBX50_05490 [Chitinophagia bacterium]|nr:hypothetical protein [Chitinophagia bacterium]
MKKNLFAAMMFTMFVLVVGCKKDATVAVVPVVTSTQTLTVPFSTATNFSFFSFKDSTLVTSSDSTTTKWDFALRFTKFLVNSNASGPGSAGVIMQDGIFSDIKSAPTSGYSYDTTATRLAIKDGSWYDYNSLTRSLTPKAGKVFIFRTADGLRYAKMQLLSVDYAPFVGMVPTTLLYKFQYTYQPNGSTSFQ